jgi:hypothetical protein
VFTVGSRRSPEKPTSKRSAGTFAADTEVPEFLSTVGYVDAKTTPAPARMLGSVKADERL